MKNNKLIDDLVIRQINSNWRKLAMVVGTILIDNQDLEEGKILERIAHLHRDGTIEVNGHLSQPRFCELKLSTPK